MTRIDHYHDPEAPRATRLVPAVTVVVRNGAGDILLQRRADNDLWALPGGVVDVGETVSNAVLREVKEETGLDVDIVRLVGIYSDPHHVIQYSDGEVRQQFSLCFEAIVSGGRLAGSSESTAIRFVPVGELSLLPMHPSMHLRIQHALEQRPAPVIE